MILTPQLRQRIEMLQMTSLELAELIEQEMVANPILEEIQPGDEVQEISDSILDQNSDGHDAEFQAGNDPGSDAVHESVVDYADAEPYMPETPSSNGDDPATLETAADDDFHTESSDSFDEIDYGREFQDYLDPGYRTQEIEYKEDGPSFEQFLTHSPNLSEHLEWQLNMLSLDEERDYAASLIIGNLDEDGRLTATNEEIAGRMRCPRR
jgi:RNA polymerase sigma-54 factor